MAMEKKVKVWDVVVIGLALFAMFFGASNLIYPPWLGRAAGEEWLIGSVSFCIADAGLALVALLSILKGEDLSIAGVTGRVGALPAAVLNTLVVLCIGPFLAIPRTAAPPMRWRWSPSGRLWAAGGSGSSSSGWCWFSACGRAGWWTWWAGP